MTAERATAGEGCEAMLDRDFALFSDLIRCQAALRGDAPAVSDERSRLTWRAFDALVDRGAAALQRDGVAKGSSVAIAGFNAVPYAVIYTAALRIGAVPALITVSATPAAIAAMISDSGARVLAVDATTAERIAGEALPALIRVEFDDLDAWLAPEGAVPAPVEVGPDDAFNIIYSSGTTGAPKGIVQSHAMRWEHIRRAGAVGYAPGAVAIISTPLYSNTTLVSFVPALARGGHTVLMGKFEARRFLETAARERATHAMLVPVQYRRIMALPDFDSFDLASFVLKSSTSAPFAAALKADILSRWPGGLVEYYGMTEGGGTCVLAAHAHPDKLHTVGQPAPGHDIRLIDEAGNEVPPGHAGEVVGRSGAMMTGYRGLPEKTREAEWHDAEGRRYIRHGDVGRFDEDGFLILMDRTKDLIISGGFNIYPSDLEAELMKVAGVADAAVVGVPSEDWGETPVGFVVALGGDAAAIMAEANSRLGKTQRLSRVVLVEELPRSPIGKVLKRELRDAYTAR